MQRYRSPAPNLKWPSEPRWQVEPALRVGLVFNERLISERLLAPGQRLQVGGGVEADLQLDRDYGGESLQLALTPDGLLNLDWGHGVAVRLSRPGHPPSRYDAPAACSDLAMGTFGVATLGPYRVLFQTLRARRLRCESLEVTWRDVLRPSPDRVIYGAVAAAALLCLGGLAALMWYEHHTGRFLTKAPEERVQRPQELIEVAVAELEVTPVKPPEPTPQPPPIEPQKLTRTKLTARQSSGRPKRVALPRRPEKTEDGARQPHKSRRRAQRRPKRRRRSRQAEVARRARRTAQVAPQPSRRQPTAASERRRATRAPSTSSQDNTPTARTPAPAPGASRATAKAPAPSPIQKTQKPAPSRPSTAAAPKPGAGEGYVEVPRVGGGTVRLFGDEAKERAVAAKAFQDRGDPKPEGPQQAMRLAGGKGLWEVTPIEPGPVVTLKRGGGRRMYVSYKKKEKRMVVKLKPSKEFLARFGAPLWGRKVPGGVPGVRMVMARRQKAIERCYQRSLLANRSLQVTLRVKFVVDTVRRISDVQIRGHRGPLVQCIARVYTSTGGLPTLKKPQLFSQTLRLVPGA